MKSEASQLPMLQVRWEIMNWNIESTGLSKVKQTKASLQDIYLLNFSHKGLPEKMYTYTMYSGLLMALLNISFLETL